MAKAREDENYSDAEAERRFKATLKRMLATPHTALKDEPKRPRKPSRPKRGKGRPKKAV